MSIPEEHTHKQLFAKIVERNHLRFARIAKSYASFGEDQDLCQEIWHQIWRSLDNFKAQASVDTWAYRIALNTAITHVRKDVTEPEKLLLEDSQLDKLPVSADNTIDIIEHFLAALSALDKALFLMYLDGLSQAQISETLSLSTSHVGVKVARLKNKFKSLYME